MTTYESVVEQGMLLVPIFKSAELFSCVRARSGCKVNSVSILWNTHLGLKVATININTLSKSLREALCDDVLVHVPILVVLPRCGDDRRGACLLGVLDADLFRQQ